MPNLFDLKTPEGRAAYQREWRKNNKEKVKHLGRKNTYGITSEKFHALLEEQEGCCAICHCHFLLELDDESPCVDHDHVTGEIRGLLCKRCNTGIGMFGDQVLLFKSAIRYLSRMKRRKNVA